MEILNLDPYVVLYHDVISTEEITHIQRIAMPMLRRARVLGEDNINMVSKDRIAELAWLSDNETAITERLNRRIAEMTGFDLRGSESLQPINYRIGGHYYQHYDFINISKVSCNLLQRLRQFWALFFSFSDLRFIKRERRSYCNCNFLCKISNVHFVLICK